MYKSIDLFAGIGGIRKGFDKAFEKKIKTVFVSEWDEYAQQTYRLNYNDKFDIAGDITKIDEKEIPEFDICLAGFPCQAFSLAGKRMGFDDDYKGLCRGTLFQDVVRICEYHQPKVIFCENVKGLTIHDKGRTFKVIKKAFEQIGYTVYDKVLNSKDLGFLRIGREFTLWHLGMTLTAVVLSSRNRLIRIPASGIFWKKMRLALNIICQRCILKL